MDPDPEIVNWILEFFLRQSLEIRTLKFLLLALPPPADNLNLKKLFLLKKLESEISCGSVSEAILDLFYLLEQVEFLMGNERVSDSMKRAFCTAAVECTVRNLDGEGCEDKAMKRFKFFEAVKRVWKRNIARMEKVEKGGLGSEALWAWKDEMEKGVWDDDVYESVLKKSGEVNGVEAVNAYIREERERMGPSFLELVAERVKRDENLQRILEVDGKEAPPSGVKELNKGELAFGNLRGASIVDHNGTTSGPSRRAEVEKAGEGVRPPREDNQANAAGVAQAPGDNMSNEPRPSSIKRDKAARTRETPKSRIDGIDQVAGKEAPPPGVNGSNASKEMNRGELASGNPRGASIVDHNGTTSGPSRSAEVEKAGGAVQHLPKDNQASAAGVAQAPGNNKSNEPRSSSIKCSNAARTRETPKSRIDGIDQVAGKEAPPSGVNRSNANKELNKGELASGNHRGATIVDHSETMSGPLRSAEVEKAGEAVQLPPEDNHASATGVAPALGDNMRNEPRPRSVKHNKAARTHEAVNAYIRKEREKLGPSFLELVAEKVKLDGILQRILGVDGVDQVAGKEAPPSGIKEMNKGKLASGNPRGATIVDNSEMTSGSSSRAEVEKSGEAVQHPPVDNQASAARVAQAPAGNMHNEPRPRSVNRNRAARTREWDESVVRSQDGRGMNLKKRRETRPWSVREEDTLRNEVEKHGKSWKLILKLNLETFVDRTYVDLKDKWRNMTKVRNTPRL